MKKIFYLLILLCFTINLIAQQLLPTYEGDLIQHTYYTLSYVEEHEQPEWVYYELDNSLINKEIKRTNNFRQDKTVSTVSAQLSDYKGSGYDRGHLCPAADMKINKAAMSETFFMSNMSPQEPGFNRGIWKKLEELVRKWAYIEGKLIIVTGGILYDSSIKIGGNDVTVPKYFYKIVYSPDNSKMIAFILPNKKSEAGLFNYVVSVDEVERVTGIDFFYELKDSMEDELESVNDPTSWHFVVPLERKKYQKIY